MIEPMGERSNKELFFTTWGDEKIHNEAQGKDEVNLTLMTKSIHCNVDEDKVISLSYNE